nr:non-specific lipid-transfer protein 2 [Ipomoea batatas]
MKAFNLMILAILLLLLAEAQFSSATCDLQQLNPCLSALTFDTKPSQLCCVRLNQQKPCFCEYVKNPTLKEYVIDSPAAKKAIETCKVSLPKSSVLKAIHKKKLIRSKIYGAKALLIFGHVHEAQFSSATCDVQQLSPCLSALTFDTKPSQLCCVRLNQQKLCFCEYVKNPTLKEYVIDSPAAKKAIETCKVTLPKC